jgi:hypothetical protein
MEEVFGIVVITISVVAAVVAALSYVGASRLYRQIGRAGGLLPDEDDDEGMTRREIIREEVRRALDGGTPRAERRVRHGQRA